MNDNRCEASVPQIQNRALAEFLEPLRHLDIARLEATPDAVYGMTPDGRLAYFNLGWLLFASDNDGNPEISRDWHLGAKLTDAIAAPLRALFEHGYQGCIAEGRPWSFEYQCSSATVFRRFQQTAYPLRNAGVVIINSLLESGPHDPALRPPRNVDLNEYVNGDGLITQCCHCRFVRRPDQSGLWDWAPNALSDPPTNVSHGICDLCLEYFFSEP